MVVLLVSASSGSVQGSNVAHAPFPLCVLGGVERLAASRTAGPRAQGVSSNVKALGASKMKGTTAARDAPLSAFRSHLRRPCRHDGARFTPDASDELGAPRIVVPRRWHNEHGRIRLRATVSGGRSREGVAACAVSRGNIRSNINHEHRRQRRQYEMAALDRLRESLHSNRGGAVCGGDASSPPEGLTSFGALPHQMERSTWASDGSARVATKDLPWPDTDAFAASAA